MKNLVNYIPFHLLLFFVLGIVIGVFGNVPIACLSFAVLFLMLGFGFYLKQNEILITKFIIYLILFFIGIIAVKIQNPENNPNYFGNKIHLKSKEYPVIQLVITEKLRATSYYYQYLGEVISVNNKPTVGKIIIKQDANKSESQLKIGAEIIFKGKINTIDSPKNPYQFNYKTFLAHRLVDYQLKLNRFNYLNKGIKHANYRTFLAEIREKLSINLFKKGFSKKQLALVQAIILGQKTNLSTSLIHQFSKAGVVHILAVSGLHIGILWLMILWLLKPLEQIKYGKFATVIITVIMLWFYAALVGFTASVIRSVTMFSIISLGTILNRKTSVYQSLVVSMFVLLIIQPFYLFDVGFQLSYVAVFSIVWLHPKIYNLINFKNWFVNKIWNLFAVSVAAQIGILPLGLYYFHQFPILFFISNLLIIPILGLFIAMGILLLILSQFKLFLTPLAFVLKILIDWIYAVVNWVSNQDIFIISEIKWPLLYLAFTYLIFIIFIKFIESKKYNFLVALFSSIIIFQFILIALKYERINSESLIIFNQVKETLLGVQKGGKLLLYSDKINSNEQFILKPVKRELAIKSVNYSKLPAIIKFENRYFLIINNSNWYPKKFSMKHLNILLTQSPKINLERLITNLKPACIIADASNYKMFKEKWKITCKKTNTPFYDTSKKGAFILEN